MNNLNLENIAFSLHLENLFICTILDTKWSLLSKLSNLKNISQYKTKYSVERDTPRKCLV